ncbi:uncharacterized protein BO72DRAFT_162929 [Aspergillus fijiensis CBS 313.89]|uniref:Secreted protein n=1 Tax=Aspergillus fijiensis CBS 313.89 TaxID=1448319 RepID=A0A8G1VXU0_9EURO|nr:uncharacterized protein BO72DRAFT_162929 [Aspergillus fijiensis CBS 313.89]RAK75616.1 hypothetical protein BO72DRAFT_162929 [Aspergillus fijiensis CBS 313.89]
MFFLFFVHCPLYLLAHAGRNFPKRLQTRILYCSFCIWVVVFFRLGGKCSGLINIRGESNPIHGHSNGDWLSAIHLLSSSFTVSTDSISFCLEESGGANQF